MINTRACSSFHFEAFLGITTLVVQLSVSAPAAVLDALDPNGAAITTWMGGNGDWFSSASWSNGVPDTVTIAAIAQGDVQFAADIFSCEIKIGSGDLETGATGTASLTGTANLTSVGISEVGAVGGGPGSIRNNTGLLNVIGGDIINLPIDLGFDTFPGIFRVGFVGGTGNFQSIGNGTLELTNGNLESGGLDIGSASGTGSVDGTAIGQMTVNNGDINLAGFGNFPESSLRVGISSGTGKFQGDAAGLLTVNDGSISADLVEVGITSPISQATGEADGTLVVIDGDVVMQTFSLGLEFINGGPTRGVFQQVRGTTQGQSFIQGAGGEIILGIGGTGIGSGYSQIAVDTATFDGSIEARFVDGYQPQPGDVYDLIVADQISGNYSLSITGIDLLAFPDLNVEQTATQIRISLPVPEPISLINALVFVLCLSVPRCVSI